MHVRRFIIATLVVTGLFGTAKAAEKAAPAMQIAAEPLGDSGGGVALQLRFSYTLPPDLPPELPLILQGSITSGGDVVKTFRYPLRPEERSSFAATQIVPAGKGEIEARIISELDPSRPFVIVKGSSAIEVALTGREYVAPENAAADAILAEGAGGETPGAVRILPPRRDLAPNLFVVDVNISAPVKRVEFYVDDKKILTRNAAPYRAELDLGKLPKRVEVRAIGYDSKGRYIDADAWVVNERDNPVEAKITRTTTKDGVTHLKVSVQNHASTPIARVELYAGDKLLRKWEGDGPYAVAIAATRLAGVDFVRTSIYGGEGSELASDLLFLDGARFIEEIQVHSVELPVTVTDRSGALVADLRAEDFAVGENGKAQKITTFGFSTNLPLSVGVLVDHSGSMKERIEAARSAALEFFAGILGPKDRAFFGGFSWQTSNVSPFLAEISSLRQQVSDMPEPEGGTALYDAIVTGLYRFRSTPGRKALIVVTDGEDTVSRLSYDEMLTYARAARVPLYFIGIGMPVLGTSRIKSIAAETGGVAYLIRDPKQLAETYEALERELRSQYVVGYNAEVTKKDTQYRTVEVKVPGRKDLVVRTIRGYIP